MRCLTTVLLTSGLIAGSLGLSGWSLSARSSAVEQPIDRLALHDLASAFHAAGAMGDRELMRSIWTDDAVFRGGGNVVQGVENIVNFFAADPGWGTNANLSPTYKSTFDISGSRALIRFECVLCRVRGSDPLTTPLSSLPPGSQNPNVEIVQHSTATVQAVKRGGVWKIQEFRGAGGPIVP